MLKTPRGNALIFIFLINAFILIQTAPAGTASADPTMQLYNSIETCMFSSDRVAQGFQMLEKAAKANGQEQLSQERRVSLAIQGASTLLNSGMATQASKLLRQSLGEGLLKSNFQCAFTMAKCLAAAGEFPASLEFIKAAKATGKGNLTRALERLGAQADAGIARDAKASEAMSRATELINQGKKAEAARILASILSDMKDTRVFTGASMAMINLCVSLQLWDEGIERANALLAGDPPSLEGLSAQVALKRALCLKGKGDHAAAAEAFMALGLKGLPDSRALNLHRAALEFLGADSPQKAKDAIDAGLPFSGDGNLSAQMLITLSRAQRAMADTSGARESLEKCVSLGGSFSPVARKILERMDQAK